MTQRTILVVEGEWSLRKLLAKQLTLVGHRVMGASSAEEALWMVERAPPDLVLTDVNMLAMSGVELCRRLKTDPRFQLIPVVILTALSDRDARVAGLAAGADDFFTKPVDTLELHTRVAALLRIKSLVDQLEHADRVITTLGQTIEARDPYTAGHCSRLAKYSVGLGRAIGCAEPMLKTLWLGGSLHDIGKIAIPDCVLLKTGPLDAAERAAINSHAVVGADLLAQLHTLEAVRPIVRHHHERFDGAGYPDGLRGEAIPLAARITSVVDVYDALRTARPYKDPFSRERSVAILRAEADGGALDPRITTTFLDILPDLESGVAA